MTGWFGRKLQLVSRSHIRQMGASLSIGLCLLSVGCVTSIKNDGHGLSFEIAIGADSKKQVARNTSKKSPQNFDQNTRQAALDPDTQQVHTDTVSGDSQVAESASLSEWKPRIRSVLGYEEPESTDAPREFLEPSNESTVQTGQPAVKISQPVELAEHVDGTPFYFPPPPGVESPDSELLESQDDQFDTNTLDFATVLALVSGQNPQVAFAQERASEAFARLDAARAMWLPSLRGGVSYNKHDGSIQEVRGNVFNVSRGSLYSGFGAQAVGTGSPAVPGLSAQFHLVDALFQPIIAERTVSARQSKATAVNNDALLDAAIAYIELQRAIQSRAIANKSLINALSLAEQTAKFVKAREGRQADADRAQTELALRENNVIRANEAIQVASARLAEVLSLDTTLDLIPAEPIIAEIEMVATDLSLNELIATALSNRPELAESQFRTSAASNRLERERYAPFIPKLAFGLSYGGFGGGTGGDVDSYRDRMDFDAVAFWEVRNLGLGELAARDEAHALVHQAKHREVHVTNRVSREVAEAYAQVQSRKKQIAVAKKGFQAAKDSYNRNLERIRLGQGLPIEVLQSLQALDQAHRENLRVLTDYNIAQFRLHRALGWPQHQ